MKIIDKIKIKENITTIDLGNTVETIVSFIIRKDKNDEIKYTPYFKETGFVVGVMKHLLSGITYDENDDFIEIYNTNKNVRTVIQKFIVENEYVETINDNVDDIVDFKKRLMINDFSEIKERLVKSIHQEQDVNALNIKLLKKQNTLLSKQLKETEYSQKIMDNMTPEEVAEMNRKLLSGDYDMSKMADVVVEKYINSELHDRNQKEVLVTKANKIIDFPSLADDGK